MPAEAQVIVVGAAVAGSAVANALGARGIPTLVVERGFERDNSTRGDFLHPPTLRFLERWSVLDALFEDGALPIYHLAVSHRTLGRLATYDILTQGEGPASRTIAVPHDRIEAVMKACAERWPSVTTVTGTVTGLLREDGRVVGVCARADDGAEREYRARLVVGCDGAQSLVRRELGIATARYPYDHYFVYIQADGPTDPPAAIHFCLDETGVVMVASRPKNRMRIAMIAERGVQNDLLRMADRELYDYVTYRVPWLAGARFTHDDIHIYSIARSLAERFWMPGAALVGDAAHTTHPAGATGMNLAISGAARLVEIAAPALAAPSANLAALDAALHAYSAERRPAAGVALERNHEQSRRIWTDNCHLDPYAYARNADPTSGWGAGGAGWGQDPAALMRSAGY
ncbi:MAG TPA: NAD(P)/FAD-dependent oxidoreductase [Chloroflexota bacterium]|nr:NAD(P)/FAD-dependent oxidoreductase [Chloroflexota bacterium]